MKKSLRKVIFPVKRDYTLKEILSKYHIMLNEEVIIIPDEIKPNHAAKNPKKMNLELFLQKNSKKLLQNQGFTAIIYFV